MTPLEEVVVQKSVLPYWINCFHYNIRLQISHLGDSPGSSQETRNVVLSYIWSNSMTGLIAIGYWVQNKAVLL